MKKAILIVLIVFIISINVVNAIPVEVGDSGHGKVVEWKILEMKGLKALIQIQYEDGTVRQKVIENILLYPFKFLSIGITPSSISTYEGQSFTLSPVVHWDQPADCNSVTITVYHKTNGILLGSKTYSVAFKNAWTNNPADYSLEAIIGKVPDNFLSTMPKPSLSIKSLSDGYGIWYESGSFYWIDNGIKQYGYAKSCWNTLRTLGYTDAKIEEAFRGLGTNYVTEQDIIAIKPSDYKNYYSGQGYVYAAYAQYSSGGDHDAANFNLNIYLANQTPTPTPTATPTVTPTVTPPPQQDLWTAILQIISDIWIQIIGWVKGIW